MQALKACIEIVTFLTNNFKPKKMEPGKTYLIRTRAVHPEKLCRNSDNQQYLQRKFKEYISPIAYISSITIDDYELIAVVKINEVNELLSFKHAIPKKLKLANKPTTKIISQQFKSLFSCYTLSYNKAHTRTGRLLERTFERHMLNDGEASIFAN
jgi:hypothetical protein